MLSALTWRLRRHSLSPRRDAGAVDIAERMIATRAWPDRVGELSTTVRQAEPHAGGVADALESGELIAAYAFRGGAYIFTPATAELILSVRQITRVWESPRFQRQGAFAMESWEPFRRELRQLLSDGPKTREEIAAHLITIPRLRGLETGALGSGSDCLYKPLHWWGDICFGPAREGSATFRLRTDEATEPHDDVDAVGRELVRRYLHSYAPVSEENLRYWLNAGLSVPKSRVMTWLDQLGAEIATVRIDGHDRFVLASDVDELTGSAPDDSVRLLPCFDAWILGPGTADPLIVPPAHRVKLSSGADFLISGGVVSGVWRKRGNRLTVEVFPDRPDVPREAIEAEARRLGRVLGEDLDADIR